MGDNMNLLADLNLKKRDVIYILILVAYAMAIVSTKILLHPNHIIHSDVLIYLSNSLRFAGLTDSAFNSQYMYLSPVYCLLTAILFKLGFVHPLSMYIVGAIFFIIGNVGLYVLFKFRFNELLSLFGVIIFTSFTAVVTFLAYGTVDMPSVAVSIWILVFLILAVDKNPKYYIHCSVLLMIGIFTKYTVLFMIPLIILYFFSKHNFFNALDLLLSDRKEFKKSLKSFIKSDEFRYIAIACVIAVLIFAVFSLIITSYGSQLTFITQTKDASSNFAAGKYVGASGYDNSNTFYIENFNKGLYFHDKGFTASHFLQLFEIALIVSLIIQAVNISKNRDALKDIKSRDFTTKHLKSLLIVVIFCLFIFAIFYASRNHLLASTAFLAAFVIISSLLDNRCIDKRVYSLGFLMISWFLVYFIFFSAITIKTPRYLLTVIPPFVYFIMWTAESVIYWLENRFDSKDTFTKRYTDFEVFEFDKKRNLDKLIKIIIVIGMIILIYHALTTDLDSLQNHTNEDFKDLGVTYDYIMEIDDDYKNKTYLSDIEYHSRYGTWYMISQVKLTSDFNATDLEDYDYILTNESKSFDGFDLTFTSGNVHLYEHLD